MELCVVLTRGLLHVRFGGILDRQSEAVLPESAAALASGAAPLELIRLASAPTVAGVLAAARHAPLVQEGARLGDAAVAEQRRRVQRAGDGQDDDLLL